MQAPPINTLLTYLLILRAKVARDGYPVQFLKDPPMTPNWKGLPNALAKLQSTLDGLSAPLVAQVDALGSRAAGSIGKITAAVAATKTSIDELDAFAASLDQTNGGPPLADSSASPANAPATPLKL